MDENLSFVETNYLNINMCKFESSQKDERRVQLADYSKACSKPRGFNGQAIFEKLIASIA